MTQRIMLYYRKYLHVELIGPQVCSSAETPIALLRFSEIASKSRDCRQLGRDFTVTEV